MQTYLSIRFPIRTEVLWSCAFSCVKHCWRFGGMGWSGLLSIKTVDYASFCDISFSELLPVHMNEL
jgi:hypothetical protein